MIHIDLIPHEIRMIAEKAAGVTTKIKAALLSKTAIDIEALIDTEFPEAHEVRLELINLCTIAIGAMNKLDANVEHSQLNAILQRLGSDITKFRHQGKHTISDYIKFFEVVIAHFLGKDVLN